LNWVRENILSPCIINRLTYSKHDVCHSSVHKKHQTYERNRKPTPPETPSQRSQQISKPMQSRIQNISQIWMKSVTASINKIALVLLSLFVSQGIASCLSGSTSGDEVRKGDERGERSSRIVSLSPLMGMEHRCHERGHRQDVERVQGARLRGAFVHPRPGLITDYLSEDWFALYAYSLEVAERLGLDIWIYDENSYPSGFAGGHVPLSNARIL